MYDNERDTRNDYVQIVARAMMAAARTAPKGKGVDNLEIITICDKGRIDLANQMRQYGQQNGIDFFLRDADNVEQSSAVVVIGTRFTTFGLNCGFCGFPTCAEKNKVATAPCTFNMNDLGIAIGSAVSKSADLRIDSRVMYSVGRATLDLGWLEGCNAAFGIVLSCTGKSPFFDRK
jgi:uncharacterized ferredoxin-like protein